MWCLQIKHLEVTLANKQELVEQMQHAHDEQLEKLAGVAEGRSQQWIQQKADMEQHYSQLLSDIHSRHKVVLSSPFDSNQKLSIFRLAF